MGWARRRPGRPREAKPKVGSKRGFCRGDSETRRSLHRTEIQDAWAAKVPGLTKQRGASG